MNRARPTAATDPVRLHWTDVAMWPVQIGCLALVLAALALSGCAALGGAKLDAAACAQNAANVSQIVGENEAYLSADATKAESLKAIQRDRNAAAVLLAGKLGK